MFDYRALISGRRRDPIALVARAGLRVASWPYRCIVALRNSRYDQARYPTFRSTAVVISVGNITTGGTGKTPLVATIARRLRQKNLRVGLVSRGYRSDASGSNDEARELYDLLPDVPHIQNPDRVAACQVMVDELDMQVIVADDAFQHRRLERDVDIVVVDATCPFGYGYLLPRGLLRESLRGLRRANTIVISRISKIPAADRPHLRQTLLHWAPQAMQCEADHLPTRLLQHDGSTQSLESLRGQSILAFAGIGNPQPFFDSLVELGAQLIDTRSLEDHCAYDKTTVTGLLQWIQANAQHQPQRIVCTHKDLVKLRTANLASIPLHALQVELVFRSNEASFWEPIDRVTAELEPD
jgi:tetraacyldisaccharide 4'-kinase